MVDYQFVIYLLFFGIGWVVGNRWDEIGKKVNDKIEKDAKVNK